MHVVKVFGEECPDFGASEIIDSNLHDRIGLSVCEPTARRTAGFSGLELRNNSGDVFNRLNS
jgi:hypothetical protein